MQLDADEPPDVHVVRQHAGLPGVERSAADAIAVFWRAYATGPTDRPEKGTAPMSFQAYLDAIEIKTGLTPRQLLDRAKERGFEGPSVKASEVVSWLASEYGLGRGHAMALVSVIKNGPVVPTKHVGSTGTHRDESPTLWLDGMATKP